MLSCVFVIATTLETGQGIAQSNAGGEVQIASGVDINSNDTSRIDDALALGAVVLSLSLSLYLSIYIYFFFSSNYIFIFAATSE